MFTFCEKKSSDTAAIIRPHLDDLSKLAKICPPILFFHRLGEKNEQKNRQVCVRFVRSRAIITRAVDGRASHDCAFSVVYLFYPLICLSRSICIFRPVYCWKNIYILQKKSDGDIISSSWAKRVTAPTPSGWGSGEGGSLGGEGGRLQFKTWSLGESTEKIQNKKITAPISLSKCKIFQIVIFPSQEHSRVVRTYS